ncbi:hypothetical protein F5Y17DRAFT_12407 [Xylariaceae sp. FL0594]|nr:hypothetical protein F5Y17DRAFT_12407 [Xylariaceae sp. FL0594]
MSAKATAAMALSASLKPSPESALPQHHLHHQTYDNGGHDTRHLAGPHADAAHKPLDYATSRESPKAIGLHSPPDSNNAMKLDDSDDSELSDVEDPTLESSQPVFASSQPTVEAPLEDEDIGEIVPDHWSGTVPVFKPNMYQFKDFKRFMEKVDSYGMKSGIIKVIPPQEWKDKLPALDDLVKQIRVREPIKQDIMGSNGTYRQVNILHQRSYNLPQWRQLCDQSEHQPPARRGERRAQAPPKPKPTSASTSSGTRRRGGGGGAASTRLTRARKRGGSRGCARESDARPMTPVSPGLSGAVLDSVEQDIGDDSEDDDPILRPSGGRMGGMRQARPKEQSTSARRKYARREASAKIDEEAFKDFDYQMDISDYTAERCEELERIYWKTLTYAPPLYGADVLGTLFDDSTECWNLNKLPNLLDVLGTKVPGVNTAYLYLGMWKATFAWHLEDVDLYSINYLHFGAPKQWYSISQGDARRFEAAMKSIWPTDAKACDQFLRHKAFLISPSHLQQYFNIKVNKCVSYPGEFVVTYPYGYHSGYNLGYNCAEAVNFALDSWLPMGKIAKKCECAQAQDSVWIDVYEIERKLRGEETDYEETEEDEEDEEDEEEDDDGEEEAEVELPTPRSSRTIKLAVPGRKRKRVAAEKADKKKKAKKICLRLKSQAEPPCCLCPHDVQALEMLPTEDGRRAHRLCALYGAETWIDNVDGKEVVANVANISKARLDLKCLFCRSKKGACFQCGHKKCARSYHATCAAAAGVLVEEAEVPIFAEDGTEYKDQVFEFSCRFHRTKRDRKLDGEALDDCQKTRQAASALKKGDICQLQYYRGDIFAGIVVENRSSEQTLLVDVIPTGDRVEVEWKWLLLPHPADLRLPHASQNAIPMPASRKAKDLINATKQQTEELPRAEEPFVDGGFVWAEFNRCDLPINKFQVKIDFAKENQIWHYLGRYSTDARPQYTEDPKKKQHNYRSNFLDSVPRPAPPPRPPQTAYGSSFPLHPPATSSTSKPEKPYQYKPRNPVPASFPHPPVTNQQFVPKPAAPYTAQQFELNKPSSFRPIFHQPQSAAKTTTYQPPPIPSPLPYYRFQTPQYGPPGHAVQRTQQQYPIQPSVAAPQAQNPHITQHQQHPQRPQYVQYTQNAQPVHPTPPGESATQATPEQDPQQAPQNPSISSGFRPSQPTEQATSQPTEQAASQPTSESTAHATVAGQSSQPSAPKFTTPVVSQQAGTNVPPISSAVTRPESDSRRSSLSKATPSRDSIGHARSKSSVSSHSGRLSLISGQQRFGTPPASYGHARADSMTKSPFSHGFSQPPGLGPSPSPRNGQIFQAQARARSSSLASSVSLNTPMTSSAIRPPVSASAQALAGQLQSVISSNPTKEGINVTQKYAFFQVHHNRDSSTYRTPYAPWGGFTNGYEGNLRAHLMRTPDALFDVRRQSLGLNGTAAALTAVPCRSLSSSSSSANGSFNAPSLADAPSAQFTPIVSQANPAPSLAPPFGAQSAPASGASSSWTSEASSALPPEPTNARIGGNDAADSQVALHPAIKASYAAMVQNRNGNVEPQANSVGPVYPPATPVPLTTMASSFGQPASEWTPQPRSSTPSRPPCITTPSRTIQSAAGSATSVKPVPTKVTPIPAPRPWEALRKAQAAAVALANTGTATATLHQPGPRAHIAHPQAPPHASVPGTDPNHKVVQSAGPDSRLPSIQQPQPSAVLPHSPHDTTGLSSSTDFISAARPDTPVTPTDVAPIPSLVSKAMSSELPSPPVGGPDLPEVSDGSMELVESIIRNAQRASGSFFQFA